MKGIVDGDPPMMLDSIQNADERHVIPAPGIVTLRIVAYRRTFLTSQLGEARYNLKDSLRHSASLIPHSSSLKHHTHYVPG